MALKSEFKFEVVEKGGNLIVSFPSGKFKAVYYKAAGQPQLNSANAQRQMTLS